MLAHPVRRRHPAHGTGGPEFPPDPAASRATPVQLMVARSNVRASATSQAGTSEARSD